MALDLVFDSANASDRRPAECRDKTQNRRPGRAAKALLTLRSTLSTLTNTRARYFFPSPDIDRAMNDRPAERTRDRSLPTGTCMAL